MAGRSKGPTREALQAQCELPPVVNNQRLQWYFNGARQLLLQGEAYNKDDEFQTVSNLYCVLYI